MAWFISFYKNIPHGTPKGDFHKYSVATYQLDSSLPEKNAKCSDSDIERGIQRFKSEKEIDDWRKAADKFDTYQVDYD